MMVEKRDEKQRSKKKGTAKGWKDNLEKNSQ